MWGVPYLGIQRKAVSILKFLEGMSALCRDMVIITVIFFRCAYTVFQAFFNIIYVHII